MHRQSLLTQISTYAETYRDESAVVGRFQEFVEAHADCFERSLEIGHITGSAWLVDAAGENVLLTHHAKLDIWVQLGGHADGESDVLNVALREAEEESGLGQIEPVTNAIFDLDVHTIPERKGIPEHLHYDVRYLFRHTGDGAFTVSEESHDLAWVPVNGLRQYTDEESMLRMADKWVTMRG